MSKKKNDSVTVSFHYFSREDYTHDPIQVNPFSMDEFEDLWHGIKNKPQLDTNNEAHADLIRYKQDSQLENCVRLDNRTIFGLFRSSYWGHSYKNSKLGLISADSLNLRPFYFMLYLSKSGRIYIASQYLGLFGGYETIRNTIKNLIKNRKHIQSHSFRLNNNYYKNSTPKEIRLNFSNKSSSIVGQKPFGQQGMIAFKKGETVGFEKEIKRRIFTLFGRPKTDIRKALADLINESNLFSVKDDDIEDCSILVHQNGKDRVINILQEGSFATRFLLNVPLMSDGHPSAKETKKEILDLIEKEIISKNEK